MPRTRMAFALIACLAAAAHADVIVIDPGTGSGALQLAAALATATPGDVILLKAGSYDHSAPFAIHAGVTLLPAPDAGRIALGPLEISGVPAGQAVVLRGLDIGPLSAPLGHATLHVSNSAGVAWIEDCSVTGFFDTEAGGPLGAIHGAAVELFESDGVLRNCTLLGGAGIDGSHLSGALSGSGGDGLRVTGGSTAMLHDCTLIGGQAGDGPPPPEHATGSIGGQGLFVGFGDATVAGCLLKGGAEGANNDAFPGISGSALRTEFEATDVRVLEGTLAAGTVQGLGKQAPIIDDPLDNVLKLSEPARTLVLPDQLREGEAGLLQIDGEPGDLALVIWSLGAKPIPLPGLEGTLVVDPAKLQGPPVVIASLPGPGGEFELLFRLPLLPVGVEAVALFAQGLFDDADGGSLGGASAVAWIDKAF